MLEQIFSQLLTLAFDNCLLHFLFYILEFDNCLEQDIVEQHVSQLVGVVMDVPTAHLAEHSDGAAVLVAEAASVRGPGQLNVLLGLFHLIKHWFKLVMEVSNITLQRVKVLIGCIS